MKFKKVLEEGLITGDYGPASSLANLARKAKELGGRKWAESEIRSHLKRITSGSGRTAHDKLNDISAMISAFELYTDEEVDEKTKSIAEKEYRKVLERVRANMYKMKKR